MTNYIPQLGDDLENNMRPLEAEFDRFINSLDFDKMDIEPQINEEAMKILEGGLAKETQDKYSKFANMYTEFCAAQ